VTNIYGRLALIALLVFAGASLWYGRVEERLQGKNPVVKKEVATPPQKSVDSESAKTDYQIILARNIFKAALDAGDRASGEQLQAEVEELAETKMQLVLLGTVSGSKEDARAIIRNEKAKIEEIYHVGSELQGAIITRIGRGTIVLQVNGREEVLNIKETEGGRGPQQAVSTGAEISQPIMQTDGSRTRPASVVVPQRRISFRNPTLSAPEPATPEPAASVPEDASESLPTGESEKQGDGQFVPNDEAPSPESSKDENAGQPAQ
jgi:type II secretory pathway component PulC